jgi:Zn finger protein HypA/HybF involved in hydrogenase expression
MHDTFLNQKICREVAALCAQNGIAVVGELCVSVHPDSHVTADTLKTCLEENAKGLIRADTRVDVLRDLDTENEAEIRSIEGLQE